MSDEAPRGSRLARYAGVALTAAGLAHFASPTVFDPLTSQAFPKRTRQHTYVDGGLEAAIGVGLLARPTRRFAVAGLLGYLVYLGANVVRNNR